MGIRPGRCRTTYVSANYFSFLGVTPVRGRGFLPEEERQGSAPVVVLSHRLWQRLGGDPKLVGEFVSVNGTRCQVVGVAPEGFTGVTLIGPDLWLPLGSYRTVAELDPGRRDSDRTDREYPAAPPCRTTQAGLDHAGGPGTTASSGPALQTGISRGSGGPVPRLTSARRAGSR